MNNPPPCSCWYSEKKIQSDVTAPSDGWQHKSEWQTFIVDMWYGEGTPKMGKTIVSYFLSIKIFNCRISGSLNGKRDDDLYETLDFLILKHKPDNMNKTEMTWWYASIILGSLNIGLAVHHSFPRPFVELVRQFLLMRSPFLLERLLLLYQSKVASMCWHASKLFTQHQPGGYSPILGGYEPRYGKHPWSSVNIANGTLHCQVLHACAIYPCLEPTLDNAGQRLLNWVHETRIKSDVSRCMLHTISLMYGCRTDYTTPLISQVQWHYSGFFLQHGVSCSSP